VVAPYRNERRHAEKQGADRSAEHGGARVAGEEFKFDDTRLKTLGLGKDRQRCQSGEIFVYRRNRGNAMRRSRRRPRNEQRGNETREAMANVEIVDRGTGLVTLD